jgi:hypothetical protein
MFKQGIARPGFDPQFQEQIRIEAEVSRAEVLGTIRARYRLPWVPQSAERSQPFPLVEDRPFGRVVLTI